MATADLLSLLHVRRGHFLLESGNHGDTWLDLDHFFSDPERALPFARALADRLRPFDVEAVCGPMLGGGVLAGQVGRELGLSSCVAERFSPPEAVITYRITDELACTVAGLRVAVLDDVIGAGSAVKATIADLLRLQANPVVIAALLEAGAKPGVLAKQTGLPVVSLGVREVGMWKPADCPLCRQQVPLEVPAANG